MSGEQVVIEHEIFIAASPQTVFEFLRDPTLMVRWIGEAAALEPQPGGALRIKFSRGDVAAGHYQEVVPHRRVAFTWGWDPNHEGQNPKLTTLPPGGSLVEIDLEAKGDGTVLRLRHTHVPREIAEKHSERWSYYLTQLALVASNEQQRKRTGSRLS